MTQLDIKDLVRQLPIAQRNFLKEFARQSEQLGYVTDKTIAQAMGVSTPRVFQLKCIGIDRGYLRVIPGTGRARASNRMLRNYKLSPIGQIVVDIMSICEETGANIDGS